MKFRCERDELSAALVAANRAVGSRPALSGLSGVLLDLDEGGALTVTGSDLDLTISMSVAVNVDEPGRALLPGRLTSDIVRALPEGAVAFSSEGTEAVLVGARAEFSVREFPVDTYPVIPVPDGDPVTLDGPAFADALRRVTSAASHDDSRPILTGVLIAPEETGLRFVATDSYRLALDDLVGDGGAPDLNALVPVRALTEVARAFSDAEQVEVRLGDRVVSFSAGRTVVTARLIEGDFPNYRALIPASAPNRLTVDRATLIGATQRVKVLAADASPVKLVLAAGEPLEVVAYTTDVGAARDTIDATYTGDPMEVAFNPAYLLDGLAAAGTEEVTIAIQDALKPAVIHENHPEGSAGSAEPFLYLLMPVRVS